jgi:hypothetical protein
LAEVYEKEREWGLAAEALDRALALYPWDGGAQAASDRLRLTARRDDYRRQAVAEGGVDYVGWPAACSPGCRVSAAEQTRRYPVKNAVLSHRRW